MLPEVIGQPSLLLLVLLIAAFLRHQGPFRILFPLNIRTRKCPNSKGRRGCVRPHWHVNPRHGHPVPAGIVRLCGVCPDRCLRHVTRVHSPFPHPQVPSKERDGEGERADLTGAPGLLVFSGQRLVSHRCSPCPLTRRAWVFGANTKGGLVPL
jgi:hypothetical protein